MLRKFLNFSLFFIIIALILRFLVSIFNGKTINSFTRTTPNEIYASSFTMIIASDPQLPWWRGGDDSQCNNDECVKRKGVETNREQVSAMNNIQDAESDNGNIKGQWPENSFLAKSAGSIIKKPLGVIMNGDLTAFWHDWQVELYRKFYDPGYSEAESEALQLPIFPGLGNHDYANNVRDCWGNNPLLWIKYGSNTCATQAVNYIKGMISCDNVSNFENALVRSFDADSLAYSWNIGSYHFVQLHNYPTYQEKDISVKPSINWLKEDLKLATQSGEKIVILLHDFGDHMKQDNPEFLDAINNQNVVALFAGHIHKDYGYMGNIPTTKIPYFRSGASEYNKFLLVEFALQYMNIGVIDSKDGVPKFYKYENLKYLNTYFFNN